MQSQWQNFLNNYELHESDTNIHGITDLSQLGLLKVSGSRAKEFLQGQLTCDLNEISPTQTRLSAHCNPQGRIISLFRIFKLQDDYYLQMPRDMIVIALNALKKYAVFFKTELTDVSDEWIKIGCFESTLKNVIPTLPENIDEAIQVNNYYIIKLTGERFEVIGKYPDITNLWINLSATSPVLSKSCWDFLDMHVGLAMIYPETTEKFLPHDLNLPQLNAVNFKKGCYTGQEIIARMQYRGKLKNQLYVATCETNTLTRGNDIFDEKGATGKVVDFVSIKNKGSTLLIITNDITQPLFLDSTCNQRIYLSR